MTSTDQSEAQDTEIDRKTLELTTKVVLALAVLTLGALLVVIVGTII